MLEYLPKDIIGWTSLIALFAVGVFAVLGAFDKVKNAARKETDETEDKLIRLLKDQVDALERKVLEQDTLIAQIKIQMESLITENKTLREVLEGRDKTTKDYQAAGLKAMEAGKQILDIVINTDKNVAALISKGKKNG